MAFHFERKVRYRTSPFQKDLRGRGKNHRPSPSAGGGGRPIRNLGERASTYMQRSASCKRGAASSTPSPARDIVVNIEGTGIGTNRKRNANFLTPSKAVILVGFLVLGLTMYLTQSYLDARSALMDREYLIHEKMKRLQVELQTMKHEVDTTKEA